MQQQITAEQRNLAHNRSDKLRKEINAYIDHYKFKSKTIKGYGLRRGQRGKGAYFFNDAKEMLQKLTLIIAEMQAGNNSILRPLDPGKTLSPGGYGGLLPP